MSTIHVLNEEVLSQLLTYEDAITSVESAYVRLYRGEVEAAPVQHLENPSVRGEIDVKSAISLGIPAFVTVKAATGFYDNPALGLPTGNAIVMLLDGKTGRPLSLMEGWTLTKRRTAAAAAVGTKYLALPDAHRLGLIGCGEIAQASAHAISRVRKLTRIIAWCPEPGLSESCAAALGSALDAVVTVASGPAEVAAESDMIVTATPSRAPLLSGQMARPGTHISAMGSDGPGKQELGAELTARARLIIDRLDQCRSSGELQHALAAGLMTEEQVVGEMGAVLVGDVAGRACEHEVTVFDSTGTAAQDVAIASLAYDRALASSLGQHVDL